MVYRWIRSGLFLIEAERAHALTLRALRLYGQLQLPAQPDAARAPGAPIRLLDLSFPNRVGLAAGFDKNALAIDGCLALGFGHVEIGTVTPLPQPGNPPPRLFRLPRAEALINRLGFPSQGSQAVAARLNAWRAARSRRVPGVLGINIGKNASTPLERAIDDYLACLRTLHAYADYFAVNISSPNTAGLRALQEPAQLAPLLSALLAEADRLDRRAARRVPLLVKLAPDLEEGQWSETAAVLCSLPVAGVIATNTTLSRSGVEGEVHAGEAGGLSGRPLHARACAAVRRLRGLLGASIPIIGVGGVSSAADAMALRAAGADLVQLYTGLVYRGPHLIRQIAATLHDAQPGLALRSPSPG